MGPEPRLDRTPAEAGKHSVAAERKGFPGVDPLLPHPLR